jgi:hypothetical protein
MRNKVLCICILISGYAVCGRDLPTYDAAGIRNPMVKPVLVPEKPAEPTPQIKEKQIRANRNKEINDFIKKCRIEGIVIKNNVCIAMINDREIKPGDKVTDDNDIYVSSITLQSITFTLDNQSVTYYLTQEEK